MDATTTFVSSSLQSRIQRIFVTARTAAACEEAIDTLRGDIASRHQSDLSRYKAAQMRRVGSRSPPVLLHHAPAAALLTEATRRADAAERQLQARAQQHRDQLASLDAAHRVALSNVSTAHAKHCASLALKSSLDMSDPPRAAPEPPLPDEHERRGRDALIEEGFSRLEVERGHARALEELRVQRVAVAEHHRHEVEQLQAALAQQRRAAFRAVPTLQRELQKQRAKHEAVVKSFEAWTADHARDLERRVEAERAVIYAECQAVLDERLERFKASLRKENESLHGRYLGGESWSLDAVLAEDARLRDGSSAALSGFGGLG